jgi:surfeit locus 1 family protein
MTAFYGRDRIGAASVAALAVVILGLMLGFWQLQRADEKESLQQARDRAAAMPALQLSGAPGASDPSMVLPALPAPAAIDGKAVRASGTFVGDRTIFLDNRTREGVAGLHVLTPLKLAGRQQHVLVLRGWVASNPFERARLPTVATPSDVVTVAGEAVATLSQPMMLGEEPAPGPQDRLWQHFEYDKFETWADVQVYPVILRQTVEPAYQDGLARDWIQPGVSVDRHLGYAFQWFALTAAAVITWLILLWRRRRVIDDGHRKNG